MSPFQKADAYQATGEWALLPFRFQRFPNGRVLVTNMVGEHHFLSAEELQLLVDKAFPEDSVTLRCLRGKHFIRQVGEELPLELLALKTRTRYRRLASFTALHMLVASLRCEHSCPYCQVSRQSADKSRFDMSSETAAKALELVFRSPSPQIKIEFQGGEPLLNFGLIEEVVERAEHRNQTEQRDLTFVIATNLALLEGSFGDHVIDFCRRHGLYISTSLDGPSDLHNKNRPRPGNDSWQRAVAGIRRVQADLGPDRVSALMTTTAESLHRVEEIVDTYVELGLHDIFLRPISPYGFAVKTKSFARYDADRWLDFYRKGIDYILQLNEHGTPIVERYAAIILKKILTNDDPGYVDLTSPAGIGIQAIVYNYDGDVYASDEGRMLAEMGDRTFRLGNVHANSWEELLFSDALLDPLEQSFAYSAPMCNDCAFEPYCGAEPVYHQATSNDFLGRKAESAFCRRNTGVFELLLDRYENDPNARETFLNWSGR